MTWVEIGFLALVLGLVLLPPKYDPAVRLKEWLETRNRSEK